METLYVVVVVVVETLQVMVETLYVMVMVVVE